MSRRERYYGWRRQHPPITGARVALAVLVIAWVGASLALLPPFEAPAVALLGVGIYVLVGSRWGAPRPWGTFLLTALLTAACGAHVLFVRDRPLLSLLFFVPAAVFLVPAEIFRRPPAGHPSRRHLGDMPAGRRDDR